jgi:ParB-like chromosome segregation protein Spo0J
VRTERVDVSTLTPYPGNPRRGNVAAIASSLARLGQYRPIVVQTGTRYVLAGNHTLAAAAMLGWDAIDVAWVDCDETTARRIVAADNRTSDLGEYDTDELLALLDELPNLDGTGYADDEIEKLRALLADDEPETSPAAFTTYDADLSTDYRCPKCAYEWSGKAK